MRTCVHIRFHLVACGRFVFHVLTVKYVDNLYLGPTNCRFVWAALKMYNLNKTQLVMTTSCSCCCVKLVEVGCVICVNLPSFDRNLKLGVRAILVFMPSQHPHYIPGPSISLPTQTVSRHPCYLDTVLSRYWVLSRCPHYPSIHIIYRLHPHYCYLGVQTIHIIYVWMLSQHRLS